MCSADRHYDAEQNMVLNISVCLTYEVNYVV